MNLLAQLLGVLWVGSFAQGSHPMMDGCGDICPGHFGPAQDNSEGPFISTMPHKLVEVVGSIL